MIPGLDKICEVFYMIQNRKDFRQVHVDILIESQKSMDELIEERDSVKKFYKILERSHTAAQKRIERLQSEKELLQKRIDDLEEDNRRFDLLDLR